jgi:hypothetical protein
MSNLNLILLGAAAILLVMYLMRRRARLNRSDD